MNMTVWNPFREMENLLDRYSYSTGRSLKSGDDNDGGMMLADWSPTVDIEESDISYLIRADIPGVDKKDIDIQFADGVLSISGEKRLEKESGKGTRNHRTERFHGTFARRFSLPGAIKADKVDANYRNGVLSLLIPKAEEAKSKSVAIKVH